MKELNNANTSQPSTPIVPLGFKRTEVGALPEDWKVERLGSLAALVTSGPRGWARFYAESGALFIRSQNVRDGKLNLDELQYIAPPDGGEGNRTKVFVNDLLITITGNSVGNVAMIEQVQGDAYISQHVGLVRLKEPGAAPYICRYLSPYSPGNSQIVASQSGQSKPGLNLQNLNDFWIAMPGNAEEQRAIATALGDVDELLRGLDRLIAKKRALKQATMQQLLSGQVRLPGFSGEWEVKRLGALGTFLKGSGVTKAEAHSGELACIRYGEIYTHHHDLIRSFRSWISREVAERATALQRGDILFAGSGETKKEIGKCVAFNADVEAYAGGDIVILRPRGVDSLFFGFLLNTPAIASQKASKGQGDAVVHISAAALASIVVSVPRLSEQIAIASVLSDMDAELAGLEARRNKTHELKQGMLQELLTGRTRLV